MGGQACVLYGAAEFSRDTDLALLASPENLAQLRAALDTLRASVIAVPPFELTYLERGHAVHFAHDDPEGGRRLRVPAEHHGILDAHDRHLAERHAWLAEAAERRG